MLLVLAVKTVLFLLSNREWKAYTDFYLTFCPTTSRFGYMSSKKCTVAAWRFASIYLHCTVLQGPRKNQNYYNIYIYTVYLSCGTQGAVGGSVPCSRAPRLGIDGGERALYMHSLHLQFLPARDTNPQPLDYESDSLTIRRRLPQ